MKDIRVRTFAMILMLAGTGCMAFAHCDTMDGPVVLDARKALEQGNVNIILKWVKPENEGELTAAFKLAMKARGLGPEAREPADRHLFETLVRLHRGGEGMPFAGIKPSGTPVDEKILAADRAIASGDLAPLEKLVPLERVPELRERFARARGLKDFAVDDVPAGREYIEAYVRFFHFAEGEAEGHGAHHHD